jgi:hypothetical protein
MAFEAIQDKLGISGRASDVERRLDDAVADSFPASDPVSLAQPHDPSELGIAHRYMSTTNMMLVGGGLLALLAVLAFRGRR